MTVRAQNPNHSLGHQGTPGRAWSEGKCRKPPLLVSVIEFAVLNPSCDCGQQRTVYSTWWGHPCTCGCGTGRGMLILSNKQHLSNFQDKFPKTHMAYGKGKNWSLEWLFSETVDLWGHGHWIPSRVGMPGLCLEGLVQGCDGRDLEEPDLCGDLLMVLMRTTPLYSWSYRKSQTSSQKGRARWGSTWQLSTHVTELIILQLK